jgi:Cu/Ag efflux pump CusA
MAVAILGGVLTSTLLSLFVVPVLYLRFGARRTTTLSHGGLHAARPPA